MPLQKLVKLESYTNPMYLKLSILSILFCIPLLGIEKIVIIDTGYNPYTQSKYSCIPNENKDFTGTEIRDVDEHGEFINSIISDKLNTKKYCIVNLKFCSDKFNKCTYSQPALEAVKTIENVKYLNISWGGHRQNNKEYDVIKELINKDVNVFISAGNENIELSYKKCTYFPACYEQYFKKGFFVVGAIDDMGNRMSFSNYGTIVKSWNLGYYIYNHIVIKGTSFSTPRQLRSYLKNE